jgi:superfamily II DNA or RNA helicase
MNLALRPHQIDVIEAVRREWRAGRRRLMIAASCGYGKTAIAGAMAEAASERGKDVVFVAPLRSLVLQTSDKFYEYGIPHSVEMAKAWHKDDSSRITIVSAQTMEARGTMPKCDLLVLDEAHCQRKFFSQYLEAHPGVWALGISATPTTPGLGKVFDGGVVNGAPTDWLIEKGYLVSPSVYVAKPIDMTGAKVVAGEWSERDVDDRGRQIVGDIVPAWEAAVERHVTDCIPKTLTLVNSVAFGQEVAKRFNDRGHRFEQLSYLDANDDRRREIIEEFRRPNSSITGLIAVDIFGKGFDCPDVRIGIDARPLRKSFSTHVQHLGRVMRSSPGKTTENTVWLDHGGNWFRFQKAREKLFAEGISALDDGLLADKPQNEPTTETIAQMKCSACGFVLPPKSDACPACGHRRARRSMVEIVPGKMIQINGKSVPATGEYAYLANPSEVWRQLAHIALEKKSPDIAAAQRWAIGHYKDLYGRWPVGHVSKAQTLEPTEKLLSKLHSIRIRNAHRKAA